MLSFFSFENLFKNIKEEFFERVSHLSNVRLKLWRSRESSEKDREIVVKTEDEEELQDEDWR